MEHNENHRTLCSMYEDFRDTALEKRLETYALWTIPSVFPENCSERHHQNGNSEIRHDYQSTGSRLVNTLASKLTSTLFPYSTAFFRIQATEQIKQVIAQNGAQGNVAKNVTEIENVANKALFANAAYAQLTQLVKLLIITGNALLVRRDKKCTVYSLKNYAIKRNGSGEVEHIIIKEHIHHNDLSPDIKKTARIPDKGEYEQEHHEVYTHVHHTETMINGRAIPSWHVTQEINGMDIGTDETYTEYDCPYIPVVWTLMNGDSYGRGYVEEYTGDFARLSELSQKYTEYELEALRVIHVYDPSKPFDLYELQNSKIGDFVQGDHSAISAYEVGVYQKLQQVAADLSAVIQGLEIAFMSQSNTRDAERVTAYEIQMNAAEADKLLGGVYSQLSLSLHLPLAYLLLAEIMPKLVEAIIQGQFDIQLIVGLQALASSSENQALLLATQQIATVAQVFNSLNQIAPRYNLDAIS